MKLELIVNGKEMVYKSKKSKVHEAITEIRTKIKKEFKKQKSECNIWFTNIIK